MAPDPLPLYRLATTDAVAFDLSPFGKLALRGPDAASFLQNFTTNDVVKPGPGRGCETFVLTAQAKVIAWARVAIGPGPEELRLHVDPGLVERLHQHLERHQIGEQLTFEDRTNADALWHICGPNAANRLQQAGIDVSPLRPWEHLTTPLEGFPCSIQRCDFVGLPGYFLTLSSQAGETLSSWWERLNIATAPLADAAWTMLRVEPGTPMGGVDFDETNLPQEINRTDQAISFTKGCYLGQETVARLRAYGHVNRQLVPVEFPSLNNSDPREWAAWSGALLKHADKEVGRVKTVAFSPRLGHWLAFALLRREHLAVRHALIAVHATGESAPVEVTTWPHQPPAVA